MEQAGVEMPIRWRGRRARAFVPTRLAERDLTLDADTVARAARAQAVVEQGAATMPDDYAALARLLLRAEGVASSFIEGVTAPVVDIVLAEVGEHAGRSNAAWVAANLAAVSDAIADAHDGRLTVDELCRWHRTLMTGSPTPAHRVGALRTEQGWIGGSSPLDANLVTPPPVSTCIAADVGGYSSGLVVFRLGDHNRWAQWFADAVSGAGRAQQDLVAAVEQLRRAWAERLATPREGTRRLRSNAAAWRVPDLLPRHLVLTGPLVAEELGVPLKSANAALHDLVGAGVLVEHGTVPPAGPGRPSRLYTSPELLGLAGSSPLRA